MLALVSILNIDFQKKITVKRMLVQIFTENQHLKGFYTSSDVTRPVYLNQSYQPYF